MIVTAHGHRLAQGEGAQPLEGADATAHLEAVTYESGIEVLLTGHDRTAKPFGVRARSMLGAYALAHTARGIDHAWRLLRDGTRKPVLRR